MQTDVQRAVDQHAAILERKRVHVRSLGLVLLMAGLAWLGICLAAIFAGCTAEGALARYKVENGARGPEGLEILPWGGGARAAPCPPPAR